MFGVAFLAAALLASATVAHAQEAERASLGIDRVGSYVSYTWVAHARSGWELGGELDLGSIVSPRAHIVVGLNYLKADIHRVSFAGEPLDGSFRDFSTGADLRVALFRLGPIEPFAGAGGSLHFLGNDVTDDPALQDIYSGTKLGAQIFGGTSVYFTPDRSWAGYLEMRHIAVPRVDRTTLRLGAYVRLK